MEIVDLSLTTLFVACFFRPCIAFQVGYVLLYEGWAFKDAHQRAPGWIPFFPFLVYILFFWKLRAENSLAVSCSLSVFPSVIMMDASNSIATFYLIFFLIRSFLWYCFILPFLSASNEINHLICFPSMWWVFLCPLSSPSPLSLSPSLSPDWAAAART